MLASPELMYDVRIYSASDWFSDQVQLPPDQEKAIKLNLSPSVLDPWLAVTTYLPQFTHVAEPVAGSLCVRLVSTMSVLKTSLRLFVFAGVTVLAVLLIRQWMATKQYVFNKEDIAKLAKQYAGEFGTDCEA